MRYIKSKIDQQYISVTLMRYTYFLRVGQLVAMSEERLSRLL